VSATNPDPNAAKEGGLSAAPPAMAPPDHAPPLSWIGVGAGWLQDRYEQGANALATWTGSRVLGLAADAMPIQQTGSGDTMISHVQVFVVLVLALGGTLVWSILDRRRAGYSGLARGFRVYLRYALAFVLLSYGFAKVPPMQFQPGRAARVTYGTPRRAHSCGAAFSPVYI
jgi:hypothetical protein